MKKTTTIKEELDSLKEGETLVVVTEEPEGSQNYYLGIGDNHANNSWPVTRPELIALRDLLNNKFPNENPNTKSI